MSDPRMQLSRVKLIKAIRAIYSDLSLKDAKRIVDTVMNEYPAALVDAQDLGKAVSMALELARQPATFYYAIFEDKHGYHLPYLKCDTFTDKELAIAHAKEVIEKNFRPETWTAYVWPGDEQGPHFNVDFVAKVPGNRRR